MTLNERVMAMESDLLSCLQENLRIPSVEGEPAEELINKYNESTQYKIGYHAGQMSDILYITVYNGDVPVSSTVSYSIESYAYSKQNDSSPQLANLVKAMMKYGKSAYIYDNKS